MTNYQLEIDDKVTVTTQAGDVYSAIVLGINNNDVYFKLAGFGKLSIKWNDIWLIQKIIAPINRGMSYGPTYKVRVFQNDAPSKVAS